MMYAVVTIVGSFVVGILLRQRFTSLCAICFAVSITWIVGLVLFLIPEMDGYVDPLALGILMGGSAIGGLYYLGPRTKEELHVFKLPYAITAFFVAHSVITKDLDVRLLAIITGIWIVFLILYGTRNTSAKSWFNKIVACCRDW